MDEGVHGALSPPLVKSGNGSTQTMHFCHIVTLWSPDCHTGLRTMAVPHRHPFHEAGHRHRNFPSRGQRGRHDFRRHRSRTGPARSQGHHLQTGTRGLGNLRQRSSLPDSHLSRLPYSRLPADQDGLPRTHSAPGLLARGTPGSGPRGHRGSLGRVRDLLRPETQDPGHLQFPHQFPQLHRPLRLQTPALPHPGLAAPRP